MKLAPVVALVAALVAIGPLHAQGGAIEIGAGMGVFTFQSGGGTEAIQFQTGGTGVYFGIPLGSRLALEPSIALDFTHVEDFDLLLAGFLVGMPVYFKSQREGFFFAPFAGLSFLNADAAGFGDSDLQFGFGASIGGKLPVAERASIRFELPIAYSLESDYRPNTFSLGLRLGVAVFVGGH